jgi:hypothetical protein
MLGTKPHLGRAVLRQRPLTSQQKLVYTLDDSDPFVFQTIDSEYGTENTFSAIPMKSGNISIGDYGIIATNEVGCDRIDVEIPDQVFNIASSNFKNQRVCAIRDFQQELIYFTYCPSNSKTVFPSQTLCFNYRDNTWAIFKESYTHYGIFRRSTDQTWASLRGLTWARWTDPWNDGTNSAWFPQVVGGNQQGYVLEKGVDISEGLSNFIQSIDVSTKTFTSPDHGLKNGDFIQVSGILGTTITNIDGAALTVFKVHVVNADSFIIEGESTLVVTGTYTGAGEFRRLYRPVMQTKQFIPYWSQGRYTRVGTQRYLFERTTSGKLTVQVYTNTASVDNPSNDQSTNPSLIYSDIISTAPEPNLYGGTDTTAQQLWHIQSNSFNGQTIQLGFTLNDEQMFSPTIGQQEIILHAFVFDVYPGLVMN